MKPTWPSSQPCRLRCRCHIKRRAPNVVADATRYHSEVVLAGASKGEGEGGLALARWLSSDSARSRVRACTAWKRLVFSIAGYQETTRRKVPAMRQVIVVDGGPQGLPQIAWREANRERIAVI
jgi:hypothetical protein